MLDVDKLTREEATDLYCAVASYEIELGGHLALFAGSHHGQALRDKHARIKNMLNLLSREPTPCLT